MNPYRQYIYIPYIFIHPFYGCLSSNSLQKVALVNQENPIHVVRISDAIGSSMSAIPFLYLI